MPNTPKREQQGIREREREREEREKKEESCINETGL
jgi:hypothetical protein